MPAAALALVAFACTPAGDTETLDTQTALAETDGIALTGDFAGPLGVQLWSVREYMPDDIPGTLQQVYDMGFREVETAGTYHLNAAQFRQMLDDAGLQATAMHIGYEIIRDSLEAVLDQAEVLGVTYVGVPWIPHPEGEAFTPEMARAAAADFNAWGSAARARGLSFFYHMHGYEFRPAPDGVLPMDVLMEETSPEDVAFEMDVFWITRPGADPVEWLQKYPDRWKLMHVKDMTVGTPTNDFSGGAPPEAEAVVGRGQIDYPSVLKAAEAIGLDKYYIEDESSEPLQNIPQSIEYLSTVTFPE